MRWRCGCVGGVAWVRVLWDVRLECDAGVGVDVR